MLIKIPTRRKGMIKKLAIKNWLLLFVGPAVCLVWAACSHFSEENGVFMMESIPGATYVGTEACTSCHEKEAQYHNLATNGTMSVHANFEFNVSDGGGEGEQQANGCETCHGPGSKHVDNDGAPNFILKHSTKRCFSCHIDKMAEFKLQHHHPVPEGRMECGDCHQFHGADVRATAGAMLKRNDETCFKCHKEMKGPFVFEHEAMRDGCTSCHNPHGAATEKLLIAGQTTVCLRCHWDVNTNGGGDMGSPLVSHGNSANRAGGAAGKYDIGRGEECIDHHRAPHGSNIWRTFNR